jgi:ABC-2 type transport system ATP-binding protein
MTVFLTTHYLDEADALCDRIAIIDHGAVVAEGTPADLKREISGDVVTADIARGGIAGTDEISVADAARKAAEILASEPYLRSVQARDGELRLCVDIGDAAIPRIMRALANTGIELATIELRRPTLDDVFLTKTGRSLRES